jgi:hypothetical protein
MQFGSRSYAFVPPQNWQVETDPAARAIRFRSVAHASTLEVAWADAVSAEPSAVERLGRSASDAGAAATVVERFTAVAGVGSGHAVDMVWRKSGMDLRSRIAVIPRDSGGIRFLLICRAGDFERLQRALSGLMTSFQPVAVDGPRRP